MGRGATHGSRVAAALLAATLAFQPGTELRAGEGPHDAGTSERPTSEDAVSEAVSAAVLRLHSLHRSLHALHDRAIADPAAPALAATLGRVLDEALAAAPPEAWNDPRAVLALVGRSLSGGSAVALAPALRTIGDRLPPSVAEALALHLARSPRTAAALTAALPDMPAEALPLAHLALGSLAADPGERARHLRRAIAFAPGTLVEDAASRRRLALPPKDAAEVRDWTRTALAYAHRFPRSPHRTATLTAIVRGLVARADHLKSAYVNALLDAAPALADPLAHEAVLGGATVIAELALEHSNNDARAAGYRSAIRVASDTATMADRRPAIASSRALDPLGDMPRVPPDNTSEDTLERARVALAAAIARPVAPARRGARAHPMGGEGIEEPILDGLDDALAAARDALERAR